MARTQKSAGVEDIKGKVGNLVFAGVRGRSVVKRHIQGPDRKSDSQVSVRSAFSIVKDSWLSLESGVINCWKRFAKDLSGTGYNFFLAANLAQERADDWRILTPLNYKVRPVESIETDPGPEEGEATISWVAGSANPAHQVWAFVREIGTSEVLQKAYWRADVSAGTVVVDGLTVGKTYRFYISVYDSSQAAGDRFSESRECEGETEAVVPPEVWFEAHHEGGNLVEWSAIELNSDEGAIEASSTRAKEGTWSAQAVLVDPVSGDYARCYKNGLSLGTGKIIYISGWWWFVSGFNLTNPLYLSKLEQASPYKGIKTILNADEELYLYDDLNAAAYMQDSPISVPIGEWVGIETKIYAHDSEGVLELWQNGARIIQVTGIDSLPSTDYFKLLYGAYYCAGDQSYDIDLFFDEVYIQDQRKIK